MISDTPHAALSLPNMLNRDQTIWLKSCPRCQTGAVVLDRDVYGEYVQCLHCGYMKDPGDGSEFKGLQRKLKARAAAKREKGLVSV
ncbi:MAG: hypothetical protein IH956_00960 [Chloroflexi bacterium]|nr:hypothetical protein [Chloroflexota bacterium]